MTPVDPPGVGALGRTGAQKKEWLIYNADYGQFWGPDSGGYFGLWGAGLYTEEKARSLASNKDRRDQVHHITEYRDQIGNMRGAFERLSAALEPKDDHRVVAPQQEQELMTTLPKRDIPALIEALRIRAMALTGQSWELSANRDMMKEAADRLEELLRAAAVDPPPDTERPR